ncbi:Thioredoxin [Artemisia annua]|uniref:Thioredoxin n=1 Tax=Artemisia annua TaxID=35608 RepID=A0A2U1L6J8_ARTAN|nr:Thioredoxin [Artemisia annua]
MAGILETLTVPRPSSALSPIVCSSRVSGRRSVVKLPETNGLKVKSFGSVSLRSNESVRRGNRIVCEAKEATEVLPVNDGSWQSLVLESEIPVMVEFWAPWCGPCRMIHPLIDELAKEYAGKLTVYKVNTDESPAIASRYGIRSIPTVIIFKGGEKKDAVIGAVPRSTLCTSIEKFL